jgi:hypothetical protein
MLGYTISQTEGPMDNLAPIYTFAWLRLLRARRAKLCLRVLSENFKTKIALFLHHFCIIFQNRGSYKMQRRSRLVTSGHLWSHPPLAFAWLRLLRLLRDRRAKSLSVRENNCRIFSASGAKKWQKVPKSALYKVRKNHKKGNQK